MNIDTFAVRKKCRRTTVLKWIKSGLIPKADLEADYIPDSARVPYTSARAKTAKAIYTSMIKAACHEKHILPILYNICEDEFNGYVRQLEKAGLITIRITDEVTYYDATPKAFNSNLREIWGILEPVCYGLAKGVTDAVLKHYGA